MSYAGLASAVEVDLAQARGLAGAAADDVMFGVEGIEAGDRAARLFGDAQDNILIGSGQADVLTGRGGRDLLIGLAGNDTLNGGDGEDTLGGDAGDDRIGAGDGNDSLVGGAGRDTLFGADGDDILDGGAGDDALFGGAGDDLFVYGSPIGETGSATPVGHDTIQGGAGNDLIDATLFRAAVRVDLAAGTMLSTLSGRASSDVTGQSQLATVIQVEDARGSAHDDLLIGTSGANLLDGGGGDDTLLPGSGGNDTLIGGAGNDIADYRDLAGQSVVLDFSDGISLPTIFAATGFTDTLLDVEGVQGSQYNDVLIAGAQGQSFWGNAGDDTLTGGAGDDWLSGGAGSDDVAGGEGFDIYDVGDGLAGVVIDLGAQRFEDGHGGGDQVDGVEGVSGTAFADQLRGDTQGNLLIGGTGADLIDGAGGVDILSGGEGDDTLMAGDVDLALYKPQDWVLDGTMASPLLNPFLTVGRRGDAQRGFETPTATVHATASGSLETYDLEVRNGQTLTVDIDGAAPGFDSAIYVLAADDTPLAANNDTDELDTGSTALSDSALSYTVTEDAAGVITIAVYKVLTGIPSVGPLPAPIDPGLTYTLQVSLSGVPELATGSMLMGGAGADSLVGNAFDDTLNGDDGADLLDGLGNNDALRGGVGADTLFGRAGDDTLDGGEGADALSGNLGQDMLDGGQGDDSLEGGVGDDSLVGGAGADTLDGGIDADTLRGADGNDVLMGGFGQDHLFGDGGSDNAAGGNGQDTLDGGLGGDTLLGEGGDDLLRGGAGFGWDSLWGGAGDDTLRGGQGRDDLRGGAQNDLLQGDGGADVLRGGTGQDTLIGGAGSDTFVFADGDGHDRIDDFQAENTERIDLSALSAVSGFWDMLNNHVSEEDGFLRILAGSDRLDLVGLSLADIGYGRAYSQDDFVF